MSTTTHASVGITSVSASASSSGGTSTDPIVTSSGEPTTTAEPMTTLMPTTSAGDITTSGDLTTTTAVTTLTTTGEPATSTGPVATTGDGCDGGCESPPGPCYESVGECVDGQCTYPPSGAGVMCDDDDGCTSKDVCDGAGNCGGAQIPCSAAHATGGSCVDGACQGFTCTKPYANCDDNWENGCEVPVGVANQCDANGLNPNGGCWTAYCGSSNDADATNFDSYYCVDCANCNTPSAGMWQWCNHASGTWYAPAAGNCGANEDLVCSL